jgi:hypothetical protein
MATPGSISDSATREAGTIRGRRARAHDDREAEARVLPMRLVHLRRNRLVQRVLLLILRHADDGPPRRRRLARRGAAERDPPAQRILAAEICARQCLV